MKCPRNDYDTGIVDQRGFLHQNVLLYTFSQAGKLQITDTIWNPKNIK